jgi:hypothetical protein
MGDGRRPAGVSSNTRTSAALFLFFLALYALTSSGNAFRVPDEFEVYFQAEHLVDAGDLSVPQTLSIRQNGESIFFGKFGRDGKPYAPYGPGVAFLILPFHVAGRAVAAIAGVPRAPLPPWEFVVGGITTLSMACFAALAVAGFHRAAHAGGATDRRATALALLLGGATVLWAYGTTLYSEALLAACFVWAAALLLEARGSIARTARTRIVSASALIAVAGLSKPTALVIAPAFVIAVVLDVRVPWHARWKSALAIAVAIALATAGQLAWNVWRFGSPLDFGYNLGAMVLNPPARPFAVEEIPRGLAVQLFAPGKSILVWAPPLVLSLLALPDAWRRERGLVIGLACGLVCALVFYAAFLYPEGGYAHGPRHLVPLVPLCLLPAAVARRISVPVAIACGLAGFTICAMAVCVSFLEDQSPPSAGVAGGPYYARIVAAPGRPWNRYRFDYMPFTTALESGHWLDASRPPGNGPDFFVVHLARARSMFPGGAAIPASLPWVMAALWAMLMAAAGAIRGIRR